MEEGRALVKKGWATRGKQYVASVEEKSERVTTSETGEGKGTAKGNGSPSQTRGSRQRRYKKGGVIGPRKRSDGAKKGCSYAPLRGGNEGGDLKTLGGRTYQRLRDQLPTDSICTFWVRRKSIIYSPGKGGEKRLATTV